MAKKNVREVALDCLIHVEKNHSYSNLLLNKMIEKHQLERKDASLLTEIVYGTIQRKETLQYYLAPFIKNRKKIKTWVEILLSFSLYQMLYLDRVPDRAVIYEAVEIAKRRGHKGISSMVNGVLRNIQRQGVRSLDDIEDPIKKLTIETSHPYWLVKKWVQQYGFEETKQMCKINLTPPPITARVNRLHTSREALINELEREGVKAKKGDLSIDAIIIEKGNIAHTKSFKKGLLTIQDESSMLVARAMDLKEHQMVLDSCAAPGGKTTHIGEQLHNTGEIVSVDLHQHKVKLIQEQVVRLGLTNVKTKVSDSRKLMEHFNKETFDRILVDAPCTGFGVMRRKPDIKYSKTKEDIERLAKIQLEILQSVAPLLKSNGLLIYSTCTVDKEENHDVVKAFLKSHPNFEQDPILKDRMPEKLKEKVHDGQVQILPHHFGTDGFFISSLRKRV